MSKLTYTIVFYCLVLPCPCILREITGTSDYYFSGFYNYQFITVSIARIILIAHDVCEALCSRGSYSAGGASQSIFLPFSPFFCACCLFWHHAVGPRFSCPFKQYTEGGVRFSQHEKLHPWAQSSLFPFPDCT